MGTVKKTPSDSVFGVKKMKMKLKQFQYLDAYRFLLTFENGNIKEVDLADLIGHYVSFADLTHYQTANGKTKSGFLLT